MKKPALFLLLLVNFLVAQNRDFRIHSHNDYLQDVPFWKALSAGASSIEADVFLIGDDLYVAHTVQEIDSMRTFEKLYLEPLLRSLAVVVKKPKNLQLLIDIKSDPYTTLDAIVKTLEKYPDLIRDGSISFVISGNRPKPSEYSDYPDFVFFDHQSLEALTEPSILNKIAMVSLSFTNFSRWNGKGRLTEEDLEKVTTTIKKAKVLGKPFRFWATPDSKSAWKAFTHLGVDFINTDKPFECSQYLSSLSRREFQNNTFSEVYRPTFKSDAKADPATNIILLIGDGNGLAQISATALANNGELSLTQLKNIGFIKTQSSNDFTTDSAGAGTALATGEKVPNRAIGVDSSGKPLRNITETLHEKGFLSGIITSDQIMGATPSAFYAHQQDRDMTQEIKKELLLSKLSVFVSAADDAAFAVKKLGDFEILRTLEELSTSKKGKVGFYFQGQRPGDERPQPLSSALKNVLNFLDGKEKPFFLMVEGANIDSYGHMNDIGGVINESIAFDKAVSEALKFADTHENTLVIITADHETGGLTLPQGNVSKNEIEADFTTDDHTGIFVPIFAYGPRSNYFQGVYGNNEVFRKILTSVVE